MNKDSQFKKVNNLYSAIKGNILGSLRTSLENSNKDKIKFYDNRSLDEIALDIEDQVDEMICNCDIYNIEELIDEDICL